MEGSTVAFRSVCETIVQFREKSNTAFSFGDLRFRSAERHLRTGCFVAYLFQLGVKPGFMVVLCMERSLDWIIAARGFLRALTDYVPLRAAYIDFRPRFAVEDSGSLIGPTALPARRLLLECMFPTRSARQARDAGPCQDFWVSKTSLSTHETPNGL